MLLFFEVLPQHLACLICPPAAPADRRDTAARLRDTTLETSAEAPYCVLPGGGLRHGATRAEVLPLTAWPAVLCVRVRRHQSEARSSLHCMVPCVQIPLCYHYTACGSSIGKPQKMKAYFCQNGKIMLRVTRQLVPGGVKTYV